MRAGRKKYIKNLVYLTIKLKRADKNLIIQLAKKHHSMSISDFVRNRLLGIRYDVQMEVHKKLRESK